MNRGSRRATRSAFLATCAPLAVPVLHALSAAQPAWYGVDVRVVLEVTALVCSTAMVIAGLLIPYLPRVGVPFAVGGLLSFGAAAVLGVPDRPIAGLSFGLIAVGGAVGILGTSQGTGPQARDIRSRPEVDPNDAARGAAWGTIVLLVASIGLRLLDSPIDLAAGVASVVLTGVYGVIAAARSRTFASRDAVVGTSLAVFGIMVWARHDPYLCLLGSSPLPVAVLAIAAERSTFAGPTEERLWELAFGNPARALVLTFTLAGIAGGILLSLPWSYADEPIRLIDALFTSFSAVCVTGLIVLDTPTAFSSFGHGVILMLIQIGGLGIMTFSTAGFVLLGRRMGVREEATAVALLGSESRAHIKVALGRMLLVTFVTEGIGAVVLALLFRLRGLAWDAAWGQGVFTAISAFCNAGFALYSDSLASFSSDPYLLFAVSVIIIVGGLGPAVVTALPKVVRGRPVTLRVHLVLRITALLLFVPAILLLAMEWNGVLAGMSLEDKIANAWFQSVTTRTAGFNSVDFGAMGNASIVLVLILMFIGGSPASTAGGIKTTTVGILWLAVASVLRQRERIRSRRRFVPFSAVSTAVGVVFLTGALATLVLFTLLLSQPLPARDVVFEVVSAIATVGLSTGITAAFDDFGKVVLMVTMLVGRVGALAFIGMAIAPEVRAPWQLPEEDVPVG